MFNNLIGGVSVGWVISLIILAIILVLLIGKSMKKPKKIERDYGSGELGGISSGISPETAKSKAITSKSGSIMSGGSGSPKTMRAIGSLSAWEQTNSYDSDLMGDGVQAAINASATIAAGVDMDVVSSGHNDGVEVLVVEDSLVMRKLLEKFLIKNGFKVLMAEDGKIAFDMLASGNIYPALIISDIEMPNMSGEDLVNAMPMLDDSLRDTPIIVVSGKVEEYPHLAESGLIRGMLSKPFKEDELMEQMNFVLGS